VKLAPEELGHMSDADIAAELTNVPGTGALVSRAVREVSSAPPRRLAHRGFQRTRRLCPAWGIAVPTPKALDALGDPFRPYRSVVAYSTWKVSADPDLLATQGMATRASSSDVAALAHSRQ
jgi:DNA-3-methyladenine glycosylase II